MEKKLLILTLAIVLPFTVQVFAEDKVVVVPLGSIKKDLDLTSFNIMKNKEIYGVVGTLMRRWGCDENLVFDSSRCETECDSSTVHADNPACNSICAVVGSLGHYYCRGS